MERTTAGLERTCTNSFVEVQTFLRLAFDRAYLLGSAALSPLWGKLSDMLGQFGDFQVASFLPDAHI